MRNTLCKISWWGQGSSSSPCLLQKKKIYVGPRGQFYFPTARHAKISQADLVPLTKSLLFA